MRSSGARHGALALAAAAALALAAASCGTKDSTGPASSYVGGWEGSTAAGGVVRFYVEEAGVPVAVIGIRVVGTTCTDTGTFTLHREPPDAPFPAAGGTIAVTVPSTTFIAVTLTGSFTSPTQASGSLAVHSIHCDGSLNTTWSAAKASAAGKDLSGAWTGTYTTSLVTSATPITITLQQSGSTLSGTYSSDNGAQGSVSGTVVGRVGRFTLTQTTAQCPGLFTGHAAIYYEGGSLDLLSLGWSGSDCLGLHTHAGGHVQRQ